MELPKILLFHVYQAALNISQYKQLVISTIFIKELHVNILHKTVRITMFHRYNHLNSNLLILIYV